MSDNGRLHSLSNALNMGHGAEKLPHHLQYPKIEGLWFNQKVVKLDGWHFEGCRFDGCRLIIETPYFIIKNCYIDGSNFIELAGTLSNAVKFLNIRSHEAGKSVYQPVRNNDGTVSIGA